VSSIAISGKERQEGAVRTSTYLSDAFTRMDRPGRSQIRIALRSGRGAPDPRMSGSSVASRWTRAPPPPNMTSSRSGVAQYVPLRTYLSSSSPPSPRADCGPPLRPNGGGNSRGRSTYFAARGRGVAWSHGDACVRHARKTARPARGLAVLRLLAGGARRAHPDARLVERAGVLGQPERSHAGRAGAAHQDLDRIPPPPPHGAPRRPVGRPSPPAKTATSRSSTSNGT
jgi:hypothetical protein